LLRDNSLVPRSLPQNATLYTKEVKLMIAAKSAYWILNIVPIIALVIVWRAYDSIKPKLFWTGIMVLGYLIFSQVAASAICFIVLLIHIFVLHQHKKKTDQEKKDRIMESVLEVQRKNIR
jgi:uncharacterized membrane protein